MIVANPTRIPIEQLPTHLDEMGDSLEQASFAEPLKECYELVKQNIRDNFTSSASPDNVNWPPRKKEGDGHPLLVDQGDLMQAATGGGAGHVRVIGDREMRIGVDLDVVEYARAHNYGNPDRNLPQREYIGPRAETIGEAERLLADHMLNEIL